MAMGTEAKGTSTIITTGLRTMIIMTPGEIKNIMIGTQTMSIGGITNGNLAMV